ncbi:hypothetical protein BVRB_2g040370 [Beta vulgaris subsp. vulgaris]|nr:hypothetical protein BVRB_2g040370 [Beta vulgaris subsp. vulgaris]
MGLKKGPWTPEEDQKLLAYIEEHGHGNWRALPTKAGLQRCGKSCRLRWTNYLRPDIKRGKFSLQEEQTIIQLHALLGNRWSAIATHLPKRTDNEIKNYWNTHLKKRLAKMGIDPVTHKPKHDALFAAIDGGKQSKNAANLSHMAQWESARLEAEARLARQSKIRLPDNNNSGDQVHINEHNQIVPSVSVAPLSSSSSTSAHHYFGTNAAWHSVWPNFSNNTSGNNNNNDQGFMSIGMGNGITSTGGGIVGGVGVGLESPTSTLSFSENAPPVVPTMETGGVIEFMRNSSQENDHDKMVKKEDNHVHEWKRGFDNGIEINSLSFSPTSAGFNDIIALSLDHARETGGDDEDEDEDDDHSHSFMEGFTELLLSTNNNASITTPTTKDNTICGEKSVADEGGDENNNSIRSSGGTTSSGGSDYYEDNKTYWNSILNLVNSSPSHSPMF